MTFNSISSGIRLAARRPSLTALVYLVNLVVALLLSIPLYSALSVLTSTTGFSPDLVERFDLVLWADLIEKAGDVLVASWAQLIWMVPVYLLWKIAMSVGLVHALRDGGIRSFWEGVGRFGGKAALMAVLFFLTSVAWLLCAGILLVVASLVFTTAEASFVLYWIVAPFLVVLGFAVLDLMHDYGRINLVSRSRGAVAAWIDGMKFPFRRAGSVLLYAFWALCAAALSFVAARMHPSSAPAITGVWLLFLGQQVVFLIRSAVTVAWFGTEVSFFERLVVEDAPLIADAPDEASGFDVQPA